jgi:hypothetical protein
MDEADSISVSRDCVERVDAGPAEMTGVRAEPHDCRVGAGENSLDLASCLDVRANVVVHTGCHPDLPPSLANRSDRTNDERDRHTSRKTTLRGLKLVSNR